MCRVKDLPTQILACLFASLMFTGLPNHFPPLTMIINTLLKKNYYKLNNEDEFLAYIITRAYSIRRSGENFPNVFLGP